MRARRSKFRLYHFLLAFCALWLLFSLATPVLAGTDCHSFERSGSSRCTVEAGSSPAGVGLASLHGIRCCVCLPALVEVTGPPEFHFNGFPATLVAYPVFLAPPFQPPEFI